MKAFYNSSVIAGHIIGLVSSIIFSYSRLVFFVDWTFKDDIIMYAYIMFVLVAHYALVLWGFKKEILLNTTNNILRTVEHIFVIIMVAFLGVMLAICWLLQMNTSFRQVYPLLMLGIVVPLIRKLVHRKMRQEAGSNSESTEKSADSSIASDN